MNQKQNSIIDTLALNAVQREAVIYTGGPELVFAGAGTGKTRVLTAKIAFLIDNGYHPGRIFAATFTNKAAREMRERVERFVSMPVSGLWIGTFHSLCAKILRREARAIGFEPSFTIYDSSDQLSVVKKLLAALNIDDRAMPPKFLLGAISARKSQCVTPAQCEETASSFRDREIAKLYAAYQRALHDNGAMDFDDLIANTVFMLRQNENLLSKYREQFEYVLVDEYQDTNKAQFLLVSLLSKEHGKIFAVGDDDQSIYGWRGAKIENILSFEKEFPNTKVFKLEENYRSTSAILKFANAVIKPNKTRAQKELWTSRTSGTNVIVNNFKDDRQEAEHVANECAALRQKMPANAIAVLFRTNAQSRVFEEAFRKKRIPYVIIGGMSFYERAEIKDCMAYLRLLVNSKDDVSFERIMNVPARGLGDKAKELLTALAKEKKLSLLETVKGGYCELLEKRTQKGFADLRETFDLLALMLDNSQPAQILEEMLRASGYMDMLSERATVSEEDASRIENVNELMNAITAWQEEKNGAGTLTEFLEEVSLASDIDKWDNAEDKVSFMTIHSAKGLEFKKVFLVGVEDGILPSQQNFDDGLKIEEERRLFYVGCTRAMDSLECSYANQRFRFGSILPSDKSRFFDDIPEELYTLTRARMNFENDFGTGTARFLRNDLPYKTSPSQNRFKQKRELGESKKSFAPTASAYDEYSQLSEPQYRVGQNVVHKTYGGGRIVNISGIGGDMRITVLFADGERRKLVAKFAKLEVA